MKIFNRIILVASISFALLAAKESKEPEELSRLAKTKELGLIQSRSEKDQTQDIQNTQEIIEEIIEAELENNIPQKKALITGITGQDGSFLSELLLDKGYEVHGVIRPYSNPNLGRIEHLLSNENLFLHYGELTDNIIMRNLITTIQPDEIYNLAAQSHVLISFSLPTYTANADGVALINILEPIKDAMPNKMIKLYQASTSEMFGKVQEIPQSEKTPFYPRSPYGIAKLYAHWLTVNYRESYGLFACCGILFNHESERRVELFVTRKITKAIAKIKLGLLDKLTLGNLDAKRDWGYAKDYVEAMWLMLQQDKPKDYVVATGETHTVREFLELAFKEINIDLAWQGEGVNEKGIDKATGNILVDIDPQFFRPTEVDLLIGDASKAREELNWSPKVSLRELVKIMVSSDLNKLTGIN